MKHSSTVQGLNLKQCGPQTELFGYRISHGGLQADVARAARFVACGDRGRYLACANPHSLVVARQDREFQLALEEADLLIPDGAGILLAGHVLDLPIRERVPGSEFFHALTRKLSERGGARYFFLGSSDKVLQLIAERMQREYPAITVCGLLSPPFKERFSAEDNDAMVAAVNAARPDVLWVGMTAPKQEKWLHEQRDRLEVPFMGAIGAVFDFYAGTKQRASRFWQRLGLEWLPRFLREPRRLWQRNLRSTPVFLYWVARQKVRTLFF